MFLDQADVWRGGANVVHTRNSNGPESARNETNPPVNQSHILKITTTKEPWAQVAWVPFTYGLRWPESFLACMLLFHSVSHLIYLVARLPHFPQ